MKRLFCGIAFYIVFLAFMNLEAMKADKKKQFLKDAVVERRDEVPKMYTIKCESKNIDLPEWFVKKFVFFQNQILSDKLQQEVDDGETDDVVLYAGNFNAQSGLKDLFELNTRGSKSKVYSFSEYIEMWRVADALDFQDEDIISYIRAAVITELKKLQRDSSYISSVIQSLDLSYGNSLMAHQLKEIIFHAVIEKYLEKLTASGVANALSQCLPVSQINLTSLKTYLGKESYVKLTVVGCAFIKKYDWIGALLLVHFPNEAAGLQSWLFLCDFTSPLSHVVDFLNISAEVEEVAVAYRRKLDLYFNPLHANFLISCYKKFLFGKFDHEGDRYKLSLEKVVLESTCYFFEAQMLYRIELNNTYKLFGKKDSNGPYFCYIAPLESSFSEDDKLIVEQKDRWLTPFPDFYNQSTVVFSAVDGCKVPRLSFGGDYVIRTHGDNLELYKINAAALKDLSLWDIFREYRYAIYPDFFGEYRPLISEDALFSPPAPVEVVVSGEPDKASSSAVPKSEIAQTNNKPSEDIVNSVEKEGPCDKPAQKEKEMKEVESSTSEPVVLTKPARPLGRSGFWGRLWRGRR